MNLYYAPQHFFAALDRHCSGFCFHEIVPPTRGRISRRIDPGCRERFLECLCGRGSRSTGFVETDYRRRDVVARLRQEGVAPLLTPWGLLAVHSLQRFRWRHGFSSRPPHRCRGLACF